LRAILQPIQALHERAAFFLAAPEVRVLLVEVDDVMRAPALAHLMGLEFSADNRSAFIGLVAPHVGSEPGWAAWVDEVVDQHKARRAAHADEGVDIEDMPTTLAGADAMARLAAALWSASRIVRAAPLELTGVTCVLAPERLDADEAFARSLLDFVEAPSLEGVRWILVDPVDRLREALSPALGERLLTCECRLDDRARDRAAAMQVAAAAAAGAKAPPQAKQGAAWPRGVKPPARPGSRPPRGTAVPPEVAEIARKGDALGELAAVVRAAAHAASTGNAGEAVRLQTRARDLAFSAGLRPELAQMELILGTFQLKLDPERGGGPAAARLTFTRALEGAERDGLHLEAAQAALGLAQLHLLTPDRTLGFEAFRRAAGLAQKAAAPALAIEALRAAGQTALAAGALTAAAGSWREALDLAATLPPAEAKATSAAEVARLLAAECDRFTELKPRAVEFTALAERLESGAAVAGDPARK
jgi:hypothetical protein